MLVLSRKKNESLIIGDIIITILQTGPANVRIGIDAPEDVPIMRDNIKMPLHARSVIEGKLHPTEIV